MIRRRLLGQVCLLWALVLPSAPFASAETELSGFQEHLSYTFMERAWRVAEAGDWREVETLTRYLLDRVPDQPAARHLLVEALVRQGRYAEALAAARAEGVAGADADDSAGLARSVRLRWILEGDPAPARVQRWVEQAPAETREVLWQSYAERLRRREGVRAALAWLQSLRLPGSTGLPRSRAILAEILAQPGVVVENLAPLHAENALDATEWRRLALAYVALDDRAALRGMLANAVDRDAAASLRRLAADRAIAQGDSARALKWLLPMERRSDATVEDRRNLWELGRQMGNAALVTRMAQALGRPCLETLDWLSRNDPARARAELPGCDPGESPRSWLILAERLGAIDTLARVQLEEPWNALRRERVVALWRERGEARRALDWLDDQPHDSQILKLRAELLLHLQDTGAADAWLAYYRHSQLPQALDQASYLLVREGREEEARSLLLDRLRENADALRGDPLSRLVGLLARPDQPLEDGLAERLLAHASDRDRQLLLGRLALEGRCELVHRRVPEQGRLAGDYVALAECSDPQRPGVTVILLRAAIAAGATGQERALAYALQASGDDAAALSIWNRQDAPELSAEALQAAARSALGARESDRAQDYWEAAGDSIGEGYGDYYRLGAAIALARGDVEDALRRDRRALAWTPDAAQYYAASATADTAGRPGLSLQWLARSVALAPDNSRYRLDYALRLSAQPDLAQRQRAVPHLERLSEEGSLDYRVAESLSLRYAASGRDSAAADRMRRAIDLMPVELMRATADPLQLERQRFAMRRSHESQVRRDTFTLAGSWSPYDVSGIAGQPVSGENYQLAAWDRVLEDDSGNSRKLAVYGRLLTSGTRRYDHFDAVSTGAGLRYKPWRRHNVNLFAEAYHEVGSPGDSGRGTDVLLRASASLLDQGRYRSDWRVGRAHWPEQSLYLDAAWFVHSSEALLTARYQRGHTFRLPVDAARSLTPYVMGQALAQDDRQDLRAGAGLRWSWWFDDDHYSAWRGRLSLRAEYQKGLGGTLYDKADGWLFGVELNW